ncbi:hypothetical protein BDQ12DRAFT_720099 [Crucibulum laeve]|uniref:Uncharacterized protein n=1 Tax=Crucibulum laeve TaxID=68775 RepID=A0A5C3M9Y9_9AGAR|nr:hypothetical protein BDQ12DRAFT_720099 [Crucibulum laeve]
MLFTCSFLSLIATCAYATVLHADPSTGTNTISLCSGPSLSGHCHTFEITPCDCYDVPVDLNDKVSSINLQGGMHHCTLYQ